MIKTNQNWSELFINNAPEISSCISRGAINDLADFIWQLMYDNIHEVEHARWLCGMYALYSLKGEVISGFPPILPRVVALKFLEPCMLDLEIAVFGKPNGGKTPK